VNPDSHNQAMANNSAAIRPFRIEIPDGDLTDLR
jgi:hypothetical protein